MMHPKLWRQYHGPQTRQHLNQSFRQQYLLVMATVSVKRFRASTIIPFALAAATGGLVGCLAVEPTGPSEVPVGSVPDPTLLPAAVGLPAAARPGMDLRFSFSSVAGQERIAYVINGGQLRRFNTATMRVENTGNFPLSTALDGWLQQDKNDEWFVGLADAQTAFAWNSQTNQLLTHSESWLNEPRLERDGRYIALTNGNSTFRLWDLATNTFGPIQSDRVNFWLGHNANL